MVPMGLDSFLLLTVTKGGVGASLSRSITWKTAISAVFIEGLIFTFLAVTGLRVKFAKAVPHCIKVSTTAGKECMYVYIWSFAPC